MKATKVIGALITMAGAGICAIDGSVGATLLALGFVLFVAGRLFD